MYPTRILKFSALKISYLITPHNYTGTGVIFFKPLHYIHALVQPKRQYITNTNIPMHTPKKGITSGTRLETTSVDTWEYI